MGLRAGIIMAIGAGSVLTLLGGLGLPLHLGARNPSLHVAVETATTVGAGLAALLVYGRYARGQLRSDLVLVASLALLAVANLGVTALASLVGGMEETPAEWAGGLARGLSAALLMLAAFMPAHEERRPGLAARRWLGGCALALAVIAAAAVLAGDRLPSPVREGALAGEAFTGHPAIAALDAAVMVLLAVAALGFTRRAADGRDGMLAWFALAAIVADYARLNHVIYAPLTPDWFGAGDVLRLGFVLCLLAGGAAEIRRAQRTLAAAAVDEERRRICRDLHDGAAQDLAYIVQAGRRLRELPDAPAELTHVLTAAEQALKTTRDAIADLARPGDEPLADALRRTAEEVAGREGVHVDLVVVGDADLQVPVATRESICRLVREAVTNAIRHGGARTVKVTIKDEPALQVLIGDDGRGFDLEAARGDAGAYGLAGMVQRVAQLGGDLRISSQPGEGTEVLVVLP